MYNDFGGDLQLVQISRKIFAFSILWYYFRNMLNAKATQK